MEEKEYIERADGIKYYRKKRSSKYDKKIQIRLADEDIAKLTELADKKETTMTKIIRNAIQEYIEKES